MEIPGIGAQLTEVMGVVGHMAGDDMDDASFPLENAFYQQ